ncbi:LamG domain-containing protein [Streptomyces sp. KS 21]|uniref:LamG domain-containing protein n=1 Tax=Streptomyces sp. KS 21 TaxID=2485150 RepID=UPI001062AAFC|nr:LamG domain-containing protein [Streptomyces sp. KS 21]TDU76787.1 concanavalin A-like lectin/glucanase superfamily protein [Streptomyces sp. KS 21]
MTDGTNPPSNAQPEPAPGNGGYGFPPVPPASAAGYGYPPGTPAPGGGGTFGPPPGVPADGGGYGYPQPGAQPGPYQQAPAAAPQPWAQGLPDMGGPAAPGPGLPGPFVPPSDQPDWEAMADRSAAEKRRKRLWMIGAAVTVLALLAGGGTFLLLGGDDKGEDEAKNDTPSPSVSASPSPSGSKSKAPVDNTPTVKDDPTQIRDRSGKAPLKMGPDAGVFPIEKRFEIRTKGNENSYAESAKGVVDTSKSFTVSAHVWNRAPKGRQIAVSQGNEKSFSFELGLDQVNGKPTWVFRVQTGDQGAEATAVTVTGESPKMEKTFSTLTGTYDAERKQIALYVNGKKTGEAPVPGVFQAQGPLQLARSRHEDKWTAPWSGAMETVQTYDVVLSPAQIDTLKPGRVDAKTKPTGSWLLY